MTKRKLFLIAADVVLLAVCICQGVFSTKDNAKVFKLKDTADEIVIEGPKGNFDLKKSGDVWIFDEKGYVAANGSVEAMISAMTSIKALDKVGSISNEVIADRYELSEGKRTSVTLKKEGNVIRSLLIGKGVASSSQNYITVDENKDVYIASGNLKSVFVKGENELRDKTVWSIGRDEISSITIEKNGRKWSVSRMGSGEDIAWNVSGADIDLDSSKASDWLGSFASMVTPVWHGENENLGGSKLVSAVIDYGFKSVSIDIFEVTGENEGDSTLYYANSSATPYTFELSSYPVQKFLKNPEDLAK